MTQTPDGVPCRHCGQPIFWDEVCWVHRNGFADCGLIVSGGTPVPGAEGVVMNPDLNQDEAFKGKRAEPEGEWS